MVIDCTKQCISVERLQHGYKSYILANDNYLPCQLISNSRTSDRHIVQGDSI